MMRRRVVSLLVLSVACLQAQSAPALLNREIPPAATEVINTTMSPYCPGLLLANCPSPSADSLRRALVDRAARGASAETLRAELFATYGEVVRAAPAMRGFGISAWVVPFLVIGAAGAVAWRWLRRGRMPNSASQHAPDSATRDPVDAELLRRIDALVRGGDGLLRDGEVASSLRQR